MFPVSRGTRARIAAITMVVLTGLSVAVPLLDRGRDPDVMAVSEPGVPLGQVDHDHALCVLHSAAVWSPAAGAELPSERLIDEAHAFVATDGRPDRPSQLLHHPRAPPGV